MQHIAHKLQEVVMYAYVRLEHAPKVSIFLNLYWTNIKTL